MLRELSVPPRSVCLAFAFAFAFAIAAFAPLAFGLRLRGMSRTESLRLDCLGVAFAPNRCVLRLPTCVCVAFARDVSHGIRVCGICVCNRCVSAFAFGGALSRYGAALRFHTPDATLASYPGLGGGGIICLMN